MEFHERSRSRYGATKPVSQLVSVTDTPTTWTTFSAPETGESFRIRFQGVSTWDYGTGAK